MILFIFLLYGWRKCHCDNSILVGAHFSPVAIRSLHYHNSFRLLSQITECWIKVKLCMV